MTSLLANADRVTPLSPVLRLEPRGDKLAVIPARRYQPDFADVLHRRKGELLNLLHAKAANLPPGCLPWLHVAR